MIVLGELDFYITGIFQGLGWTGLYVNKVIIT